MIFAPFCVNEFSVKWKFDQDFTTLSFKNGIPFYRECTVRTVVESESFALEIGIQCIEIKDFF